MAQRFGEFLLGVMEVVLHLASRGDVEVVRLSNVMLLLIAVPPVVT